VCARENVFNFFFSFFFNRNEKITVFLFMLFQKKVKGRERINERFRFEMLLYANSDVVFPRV
jgi:hypothetical protein